MRRRDAEAFHGEHPEATRTGSDDATAPVREPGRIERTSVAVAPPRVHPPAAGQRNAGEHTAIHRTLVRTARVPARAPPGCTRSPRPIHLTLAGASIFSVQRRGRRHRMATGRLSHGATARAGSWCLLKSPYAAAAAFPEAVQRRSCRRGEAPGENARRGEIPAVEGERPTAASA